MNYFREQNVLIPSLWNLQKRTRTGINSLPADLLRLQCSCVIFVSVQWRTIENHVTGVTSSSTPRHSISHGGRGACDVDIWWRNAVAMVTALAWCFDCCEESAFGILVSRKNNANALVSLCVFTFWWIRDSYSYILNGKPVIEFIFGGLIENESVMHIRK